ncbi:hypothetical protein CANCADRAFT_30823 [Tortispora caseinolytica NRRL Y-17796]|uniref:Kri1-like C-terminal domain-containing protein n=1 Tax=Tortispora caseinolytica NRRL Y-17796 TaxID=767744 RepID=A0A1E4TM91_9ASCO|nr:hypothetical protein CANCADRAFT_30823 [Tortispora caseinolytica NRRL Y-17796]
MPRKSKKARSEKPKQIFDEESDGEKEVTLSINEDYAKRFQHNKEREELERLKSKYDSDEDGSSSSDEDEDAELITGKVEEKFQEVLQAIRSDDSRLFDKNVRFFDDADLEQPKSKDKPVYLKDYQRERLLNGEMDKEEGEGEYRSYVEQEAEERDQIVNEMHKAAESADEDDDFLVKSANKREVTAAVLPDPNEDKDAFLNAYVSNPRAWKERSDADTGYRFEEDDDEFDDKVDRFEAEYNFRFEEPGSSEIVSFARNVDSVRREEVSSRKRARQAEKEKKEEEKKRKQEELSRMKNLKTKQIMKKLEKVQKAIGDEAEASKITPEDLEKDFDPEEWDDLTRKVFNEVFYSKIDAKKPEWDDEIPIDDIVAEPEEDFTEKIVEKRSKKRKHSHKNEFRDLVEGIVEKELTEVPDLPEDQRFRYRDVSPDAYGLTAEDIFLADDKALNAYVSLRKMAPYRPEEKKQKDRKTLSKKKRLKEWRKSVFGSADGPQKEHIDKLFGKK